EYFSRWADVDHIYTAVWKFQGHVKSLWCDFWEERQKDKNKQPLTWDGFVKWLTDAVPNRPTLQLRAVKILHEELRQKEGQKVQDFLGLYLDAEAELMVTLPESYRVCAALHKLLNPFYHRILSG